MNLFEYFRQEFGVSRTEKMLEKIERVVDWKELERRILSKRERGYGGEG